MRAGRAIRQQALVRRLGSTQAAVAGRLRHQAATEQVSRERAEKFPQIDTTNLSEVLAWQEQRLRELVAIEEKTERYYRDVGALRPSTPLKGNPPCKHQENS